MLTKEEYLKQWFSQGIEIVVAPCSNACWHCYTNAKINANKNIELDDLEYFLQEIKKLKDKYNIKIEHEKIWLFFYQELLLHPKWLEICELSEEYDCISVEKLNLTTNGSAIAKNFDNSEFIEKFRKLNPDSGQLVFHGKKERHDKYVARKGAFDDVVKAAKFFRRENKPILWQYFFSKDNIDDFPEVYSLMEELSGEKPRMRAMIGSYAGRMIKNDHLRPTRKDFERLPRKSLEDVSLVFGKPFDFLGRLCTEKEYLDTFDIEKVIQPNPNFVDSFIIYPDLSMRYDWDKNIALGNLKENTLEETIFFIYEENKKLDDILKNSITKRVLERIIKTENWKEKYDLKLF